MTKHVCALAALTAILASLVFAQGQNPQPTGELIAVPAIIPLDKLPEFEVADVRPNKESGQPRAQMQPGGRLDFRALPIKFMVLAAWGYENDESRVTGGPSWAATEAYDIVAKAKPDASIADLRLMLRSLLYKRFGLEMHMEDRPMPVFALEKGKGEPKVTPSAAPGRADCNRSGSDGQITAKCHNITMDEVANALRSMAPGYIDKPVVNLTGMTGQFDFEVTWTGRGRLLGGGDASASAPKADGTILNSSDGVSGMTIFDGIDKYLGLKLNSTKHAMPVIVIDKVNRTPTEN